LEKNGRRKSLSTKIPHTDLDVVKKETPLLISYDTSFRLEFDNSIDLIPIVLQDFATFDYWHKLMCIANFVV
jgi:hypothetical protein